MNIYPQDFEDRIGFGTLREELIGYCHNEVSRFMVGKISFLPRGRELVQRLELLRQMIELEGRVPEMPTCAFNDLKRHLRAIRPEGSSISIEGGVALRQLLSSVMQVVQIFEHLDAQDEDAAENFPALRALVKRLNTLPDLRRKLHTLIDEEGEIKDTASQLLREIRIELRQMMSSVGTTMRSILRQAQTAGWVEKDATPTMRDGRLLLPVIPHAKREIGGIVHEESATGRTLFVEPEQIVALNNCIREKQGEEKREINRLLRELTDYIRPEIQTIQDDCTVIGTLDFLQAKSAMAYAMKAIVPQTSEDNLSMEWWKARHPLLERHLKAQHRTLVPLDIRLTPEARLLVISGPNAGGKSATLKTVALLQYMLQCGLAIPIQSHSTCRFFDEILLDIGDQQSLENDLSTYSSHLQNMKIFSKKSTANSLLLVDEFGSGTEPRIGGAIAEALLDRFRTTGAYGVITTHYSNIKEYSEKHEGTVNGAMLFDRQKIRPLYQLYIGHSGSSFAIEIARSIGLPEDILDYASKIVGLDYMQQDMYLQDIMRDKAYWAKKRAQIKVQEKTLERKQTELDDKLADISSKRSEILDSARKEALKIVSSANATIEQTIREIKEAKAEKERTQKARATLKERKDKIENQIKRKEIIRQGEQQQHTPKDSKAQKIEVGTNVTVKGGNTVGEVIEIRRKKALVRLGGLTMELPMDQLTPSMRQATVINKRTSIVIEEQNDDRRLNFKPQLDLRGKRVDEALQTVTYFIDDAVRYGYSPVRVLHGTGTGALREAIRQLLATNPKVTSFADEHVDFGGAGITVINL